MGIAPVSAHRLPPNSYTPGIPGYYPSKDFGLQLAIISTADGLLRKINEDPRGTEPLESGNNDLKLRLAKAIIQAYGEIRKSAPPDLIPCITYLIDAEERARTVLQDEHI